MSDRVPDRVLDATALQGLAHPLRVQLCDQLSMHGPATATQLAARLNESSGATSYHLRQLEKYGFVEEDPGRGSGRERWWRRVPGRITIEGHALAEREPGRTRRDEARAQRVQPGQTGAHPGVAGHLRTLAAGVG